MPRLQVYLPDELYEQLKAHDLPASELLQTAVRAELERRRVVEATDQYLAELADEVGDPTARQAARADAITRKVRERNMIRVG
jgi:post-segregation antitoxin (ccd killing protein)